MPIRLVTPHPNPLPQGERELLLWCNALCLLHPTVLPQEARGSLPRTITFRYSTLLAKPCQCQMTVSDPSPYPSPAGGEGIVTVVQCAPLIAPYAFPVGGGDCYRGRLRFANRPYSTLLDPTCPGVVGNCVEGGTLASCRRRGMPGWHPPTTLPPLALATTMRR